MGVCVCVCVSVFVSVSLFEFCICAFLKTYNSLAVLVCHIDVCL